MMENSAQLQISIHNVVIRNIRENDNQVLASIVRTTLEEFDMSYFKRLVQYTMLLNIIAKCLEMVVFILRMFAFRHLRISKNVYAKESKGNWFRPFINQKNLDFAKEAGYKNVYLESMPELTQGLKIYETFGFHYIDAPMGNTGHYWL